MPGIAKQITDLIGNFLLEFSNYNRALALKSMFIGKLEYFNPAGSVKDRLHAMILAAEEQGLLKKDSVIIEPTSGNTGSTAMRRAARGYKLILTMPETMSIERRALPPHWERKSSLPGAEGMAGAIRRAEEPAATSELFHPATI